MKTYKDDTSNLEIIIPVKNRHEIRQCVQSLNSPEITKVIVCDGGSTDNDCLESLQAIKQDIELININTSGFNKSKLINKGIEQASCELILISDADIIWNQAAIDALLYKVKSDHNIICCIQDVEESNPGSLKSSLQKHERFDRTPDNKGYSSSMSSYGVPL